MTTFKEIRGTLIKSLSSDPSPAAAGEMWYNSTSQTLKGQLLVGAWASGGNMNTARSQIAGFGIQTAAIYAGGYAYGPNSYQNASEEYNGSAWTSTPNMPVTLGFRVPAGTTAAGLASAGHDNSSPNNTSEWDGSGWTNGGNVNNGGYGAIGSGSQTAAFIVGSSEPPNRPNTQTEEYNGSAWTVVPGTLNTGRGNGSSSGSQTDGIYSGGAPSSTLSENYNGTVWAGGATLITGMNRSAASGGTAPSNSVMIAGSASTTTVVQETDGTSWFAATSLGTGRGPQSAGGAGASASSSLVAGGNSPSITATEEFTKAAATKTFTTS